MRITNKRASSSCESGQTKTAEDIDPERIEDNASCLRRKPYTIIFVKRKA